MILKRYNLVLICLLIIVLAMIVPPVLAATLTINPGNSIQTAINNANSGDTIILNPGHPIQGLLRHRLTGRGI